MRLKVKDMEFGYANVTILKDVTMELAESEVLGVVGPNGAGKSTLIRCIDRIISPQKGSILVDGTDIKTMSSTARAKNRLCATRAQSKKSAIFNFSSILSTQHFHRVCKLNYHKVIPH